MTDSKSSSEGAAKPQTTDQHGAAPRPFTTSGRVLALTVLGFGLLVRLLAPDRTVNWRSFDAQQRIAQRPYAGSDVSIVAVDDHSIAKYGQWPWPRTLIARLVRKIAADGPRVLAVDILFPEPDRLSPGRLAESLSDLPASLARDLAALPPNEVALAEAFRMVPTVLAIGEPRDASAPAEQGSRRVTPVRKSGADPLPFVIEIPQLLSSLPEITAAERGRGVIIPGTSRSGIVRCVPLFVKNQGTLVPAFALETLRVAFGVGSVGVETADDGIQGATLGDVFIPTDRQGCAYPHFTTSRHERYISAADLLDGKLPDPARLRDRLVLLGVTGQGASDLTQTPLGPMEGVEIHAQLAETILSGDLLHRPSGLGGIEIALALAAGLVTIFALPYHRPWLACAGFLGLALLILGTALGSFIRYNLMLDGIYPIMASGLVFALMLAATLRAIQADNAHEREIKARLKGELNAARAIQMRLVPRLFPAPPEHPDLEVFARIEPAQEVGGDLYDFVLIDGRRLSFAIADVSGKGFPAALFMAMTKEILRDATARHGAALDRVLAEANAKISATSGNVPDEGATMMFVTVFVGVLDLSCGRLAYASAGHDAPFLLRSGAEPLQLTGEGGPPLGAVDDFPYPLEHRQLAPGDVLLLYTDGVTESEDVNQTLYSTARLARLLASAPTTTARAVVDFVREDVYRFAAAAEQADDITLLAIRWLGGETAPG